MDELDDALSKDDPLVPSSGFAVRVMEGVREAATGPPPFPFPWARFTTGLVAAAASVVSGALVVSSPQGAAMAGAFSPFMDVAPEVGSALAVTVACLAAVRARVRAV